ncbi:MAG: cupin domain-containing protein [Flavobacteriaceae bacterium]
MDNIGGKLRALREKAGLSQRALAQRAGVRNSTISLIESGRMNPSVGALKRVLDGVGVSMSEFFADDGPTERPVFFRADELTEIGKGGVSYRQIGSHLAGRRLQMLAERYAPGADTGDVSLRHEGEECGIVIAGRIEVTVGESRRVLGPGDAYAFDSTMPHRFRNSGAEPCEIISACSPPTF